MAIFNNLHFDYVADGVLTVNLIFTIIPKPKVEGVRAFVHIRSSAFRVDKLK